MKYIYSLMILLSFSVVSFAQVPDWMLTDIDGEEHHLYSTLEDGKVAIIDFSATWCGPCWGAHTSGVLDDIYTTFGPDGADIVRVYYLECDPDTGLEDLQGTGSNTLGDWITGTHYPIIDLETTDIPNAYGVTGYPTILFIDPDKTVVENLWSVSWGYDYIANKLLAYAPVLDGTELGVLSYQGDHAGCESVNASVYVRNGGTDVLESITFEVFEDADLVHSYDWTGTLKSGETTTIDLGAVAFSNANTTLTVKSTLDDQDDSNNEISFDVSRSEVMNVVTIAVQTDAYCELDNTNFKILDPFGNEVYASGSLPNSTLFEVDLVLEETGCYSIVFSDDYGDGIGGGSAIVTDAEGGSFEMSTSFGSGVSNPFVVTAISAIEDISFLNSMSVFPNPVNHMLFIELGLENNAPIQLEVYNQVGQKIISNNKGRLASGLHTFQINTSDLTAGMYLLQVRSENEVNTIKFIK